MDFTALNRTLRCAAAREPAIPPGRWSLLRCLRCWQALRKPRLSLFLLLTLLILSGRAQVPPVMLAANDDWAERMFSPSPANPLLPEFEDSYGAAFRDLNGDGRPDLYVVRFRELNRLFVNEGAAAPFSDYTIQSGLGGNLTPHGKVNLELGASAVDYDNDGRQDILIVGWGHTTYLFRQSDGLHFEEILALSERYPALDGNAGVWADVNRDGNLDLFITDEHHSNHLLLGDGKSFRDVSEEFGVAAQQVSQGAAFADVDGDGYPDLYVCNWFSADLFYRNVDGQRFERMNLPLRHLQAPLKSNGVTFGDIDNDGRLDLLVTDRQGFSRLYRNETPASSAIWRFIDITDSAGIDNVQPAYGSVIADFDNDGWQDVFFANIGPNQLFVNSDSLRFHRAYRQEVSPHSSIKYYSTGAAVADFDGDGDVDLFVASKDTHSVIFRNPVDNHFSISLVLEGVRSNRDAIGAKIWLFRQDAAAETAPLGYREVSGGSGYLSMNDPTVHFGTGGPGVFRARVRFPSGKEILLDDLRPGQIYRVRESGGIEKAVIRGYQHLSRHLQAPRFWLNFFLFCWLIAILAAFLVFSARRYNWQPTGTSLFLIAVLILLYLIFWLLSGSGATVILLIQIASILFLTGVLVAAQEKILRVEKRRYGYRQVIRQFSQELIFIKDNDALYPKIAVTVAQSMNTRFCCVFEIAERSGQETGPAAATRMAVLKQVSGDWAPRSMTFDLSQSDYQWLCAAEVVRRESARERLPALAETGWRLIVPLVRKEKLLALLILGERHDPADFRAEDIEVLQILANHAAIAIENNLYIEESKKLIQRLTQAEVREKYVAELEEKNEALKALYRNLQETQAQLIQSEKMAGLGQLVAGVAHELNNPISFIYANLKELRRYSAAFSEILRLLKTEADDGLSPQHLQEKLRQIDQKYDLGFIEADIDKLIDESAEGSRRVKNVVQNLRNFSRLDEGEYKAVDLHDGLESTLTLLQPEMKGRITVHKEYGKLPLVACNPGQLNQVFMNLLLNAVQAIEGEGEIWVSTCAFDDRVEIKIRDNGKGIPEDIRHRIFDPFFSTKPVGKGTGLGLSISYKIIEAHHGKITLESTEGQGTTFTIVLPLQK